MGKVIEVSQTIEEKLVSLIKDKGSLSFVEYEDFLDRNNIDRKGDTAMFSGKFDNVLYWCNLSDEAVNLLSGLVRKSIVELKPTDIFIYYVDGKTLNFPIVKQARNYKSPHWVPSLIKLCD